MYIIGKKNDIQSEGRSLRELLEEYMQDNGLSKLAMASILDINRKTLDSILSGKELKLNHALRIIALLNISNNSLIDSYLNEAEETEIDSIEKTKTISFILENFYLEGLKDVGIIKATNDFSTISEEICSFFGFSNILEYRQRGLDINPSLFSKSRMQVGEERQKKMEYFWVKCAIETFRKTNNPNSYNEVLLLEFMKRIKSFTKDVHNGFSTALLVLYQLGITVLVQPYMKKTKSFGISMIINEKPCIIVTDLGKKYHTLWLTLLHELYHVIHDFEYLEKISYHISDSEFQDIFISEDDANLFARNMFIPHDYFNLVSKLIKSPYKMAELAKKMDVHVSLLYGVYLESLPDEKKKEEFPKYSKFLLRSDVAIKNIIYDPIGQRSIDKSVERIKEMFNAITA